MCMTMKEKCIYCGKRDATDPDHVPPKCFFSKPRPSDLITVPSCRKCNNKFSKVDERARNLLTSLDSTEKHSAIKHQIANKRNCSLGRLKGKSNLIHMLHSIKVVDSFTPGGIYLGKAIAINLDQDVMDIFLKRMARALLFYENKITYFECYIEWEKSPSLEEFKRMPINMQQFFKLPCIVRTIGEKTFQYAGWYLPGVAESLWILRFYDGIEFMIRIMKR